MVQGGNPPLSRVKQRPPRTMNQASSISLISVVYFRVHRGPRNGGKHTDKVYTAVPPVDVFTKLASKKRS